MAVADWHSPSPSPRREGSQLSESVAVGVRTPSRSTTGMILRLGVVVKVPTRSLPVEIPAESRGSWPQRGSSLRN